MPFDLSSKVAIVTGAGQGLGEAIARALAAAGARVAVNDLNPDRARRVAEAIDVAGGEAIAVAADVSNKFQCVHLVETTRTQWGRLDILVNNAAVEPAGSLLKLDEWDWDRCLDVNLKGTFLMTQLCARVMVDENRERGGAIINIAATAGVVTAAPGRAAFCASKAGVVGLSREVARELAPFGIRVNTILPGLFETPSAGREQAGPGPTLPGHPVIPTGRPGRPEEAAQVALFLASDASSYMTGSTVTVDGGWVTH